MNPRILKKLSKRIVLMGHPVSKNAWIDKDPVSEIYIGTPIWGEGYRVASAAAKRSHYMTQSRVTNCYVVGGGPDYWGEAMDPHDVYSLAKDHVLWAIGTSVTLPVKDENGVVVDEQEDWPETKKRLTGALVIKHIRKEVRNGKKY